ncbi:MAG: hypothetical protein VYD71_00060 [Bacteroidota bacterium]|nr:hypothetical protein [Bacteroidota bacterium]
MQAPKFPSFLKTQKTKVFDFKPRYYDKRKDELEQLKKQGKKGKGLFYNKKRKEKITGNRSKRLVIILIALLLLFYLLLT